MSAAPVKDFFVEMLTRDIALDDAILDLLDNSVDGAMREIGRQGLNRNKPYAGYWAEIEFSEKQFLIRDNCGGIPRKRQKYAFQMGRKPGDEDARLPTVGAYGIGMKRAIFKLGRDARVYSKSRNFSYTASYPKSWFNSGESEWDIPVEYGTVDLQDYGTEVNVTSLIDPTSRVLKTTAFEAGLRNKIATYYAFIMQKGFEVWLNGAPVVAKPIKLRFSNPKRGAAGIQPYVFKRATGRVKVFMAVGFTDPIPSDVEAVDSDPGGTSTKYRSMEAGWTVVCNDRVVIYCDKTGLTGWGDAGVPRFHTQFTAISGIVEFRSDDAAALPTTTTKLGIDASSELYIDMKNKMREGMRVFTTYTNKWKGQKVVAAGKKHIRDAPSLDLAELKKKAATLPMTRSVKIDGEQYKPSLPTPGQTGRKQRARITFSRPITEVGSVSKYLFEDESVAPSRVGEDCFELILKEAKA